MAEPVPFFRPEISEEEIANVVATLRSGWLTTGPRCRQFEAEFAAAVGAPHAVALNSCTAALHLATVVLGLKPNQGVLVPTMTFAATAEILRYSGAVPILVDCDAKTLNMDLADAERKVEALREGRLPAEIDRDLPLVGLIPVHVAGNLLDPSLCQALAHRHGWWLVEDAAHAFPAAWRPHAEAPWQRCGEQTAAITCYSFYANKTLTTGEGGMATTHDAGLADSLRSWSLHGLSHDAWGRYTSQGAWDYRILAPGYKDNLTDVAAALGLGQLARAETLRLARERVARHFFEGLADLPEIELPPNPTNRIHSWHLFQIKLHLETLEIDRDRFLQELRARGIGFSVHWRPLHLHPYYQDTFGWLPEHLPVASAVWRRTISLPIFPAMRDDEISRVVDAVRAICAEFRR